MLLPACTVTAGTLVIGQVYEFKFTDVDGRTLSTADGHVTVLVITTRADLDKARLVGDRTPEHCLGDPTYRMITLITFDKPNEGLRFALSALIRHRLDQEAERLKPRYLAKKLTRDPRTDMYAVADFDGAIAAELGINVASGQFSVLVFGRNGDLLARWDQPPGADELAAILK
jgi:hypothetical protein